MKCPERLQDATPEGHVCNKKTNKQNKKLNKKKREGCIKTHIFQVARKVCGTTASLIGILSQNSHTYMHD